MGPIRCRSLSAAVLAGGLALAGCGSSGGDGAGAGHQSSASGSSGTSSSDQLSGTVTVFAAASLKETFTTLGTQFEAAHPATKIVLNFGPSSGLAEQINQGAPADVFASASPKNMEQVVSKGGAKDSKTFAKNVMEVAVPADNKAGVTDLNDLAKPSVKVAVCQPEVPCGVLADRVFKNASLKVTPVSLEVDVKSVLTKVTLGEVDAGLVYVTDVRAAGNKVKGVRIKKSVNASTDYPIATLTTSSNGDTAHAFTDYVLSAAGTTVLTKGGFEKP